VVPLFDLLPVSLAAAANKKDNKLPCNEPPSSNKTTLQHNRCGSNCESIVSPMAFGRDMVKEDAKTVHESLKAMEEVMFAMKQVASANSRRHNM